MSDSSNILNLPFLLPSQAQKHVTHNEALRVLDALVQMRVITAALDTPPADPEEGACYIVPAGALDEWAGQDGTIAVRDNGAWAFFAPLAGWRTFVQDTGEMVVFDGADWVPMGVQSLQSTDAIGIGMDTDPGTGFAAKVNDALWTALSSGDGGTGDIVQRLNKSTSADDAGIVLQSGYQTRALFGLFGSDKTRLSVTPDGFNFNDALVVDQATGIAELPALPRFKAITNYDNYAAADTWVKVGINNAEYNDQGAFDAATNLFTAPVAGTYMLGASLLFSVDHANPVFMRGRLVKNGTDQVNGSFGEVSGPHESGATVLHLQTLVSLGAGDTVELQGYFRGDYAYLAADGTTFYGYKIG